MAQINRIRVNNVKYNFGTQFYDDFLMRLSGKNTIYDLANGGGKSVLMLLLLQNMIPNCTLDDKQPIEKLFRSGNDNTTIHSLVEWKLDACDIRNGCKYMTTGFCARKGREQGEESTNNRETANIEYFNYCIFYREFGENDIKNLPLVKNGERITYNGLKTYLRDLEKKDFGVEVRIFDRKGDYQNFISNYGLYESQWEIIRGINKTEGHVRTYFENNYKTTRKVVEDLLIEEIIEKSYNNRIRKDSESGDDEEMAKTLMDIKDKLIELSKRKGEMGRYDEQISLLEGFGSRLHAFTEVFAGRKDVELKLLDVLFACRQKAADTKKRLNELELATEQCRDSLAKEARLVALAEIETELAELEKLESLINETMAERNALTNNRNALKDELYMHENAADYQDYLTNKRQYDETKALINSSNSDGQNTLNEMAGLAAAKELIVNEKSSTLNARKDELFEKYQTASSEYDSASAKQQQVYGSVKVCEGLLQGLESEISAIEQELAELLKESGLLVADNAWDMCESTRSKAESAEKNIEQLEAAVRETESRLGIINSNGIVIESEIAKLNDEEQSLQNELGEAIAIQEKTDKIKNIYNAANSEQLETILEELLYRLNRERTDNEQQLEKLVAYENDIKNHRLPEYELPYNSVLKYLKSRYGEIIMSGNDILSEMGNNATEVLSVLPQAPFAVFVKASDDLYKEICRDKVLETLNTGGYIIPVLKYSVIEDGLQPFETEAAFGACRNMGFLWDEAMLAAEIQKNAEEISHYQDIVGKCADKCRMVAEDEIFIKSVRGVKDADSINSRIQSIQRERDRLLKQKENEIIKTGELKEKLVELADGISSEKKHLEEFRRMAALYEKAAAKNDLLNNKYSRLKEEENKLDEAKRSYSNIVKKAADRNRELVQSKSEYEHTMQQLDECIRDFEVNFKPYLQKNVSPVSGLTEEELNAQMAALRKIVSGELGDISDKEKLLASYEAAMKKSADNILYRGMTMEEAAKAYEEGRLNPCSIEERLRLKIRIQEADKAAAALDGTLDAQSAQKNRMEGSIEHGRRRYQDKYGEPEREHITNPQAFIVAHRQEMSRIEKEQLEIAQTIKKVENDNKDILFMEKDVERIIRNAGIEVAENINPEGTYQEPAAEDYEKLQKQFEKLQKEENRLRSRFVEDKQELVDSLNRLGAYELAGEVRSSLLAPSEAADVEEMIKSIQETNECIALERDRIEKSIADMERIKDSFENRCVQICSNIRTELDRLPKLSRITMDDEVIPIITLSIPYIKEELYKDRMSVYINETVAGAETFDNPADKLKYMKNRLSWKRMFSVIVTDMNSIKLCLYKREHIKDQSRYLKYEEAVGSTGQSQGIYIQFLIAVIHYISSLNALGKDVSVIGKTIFIDNPFGAAKDVYIWEPIFKLLKTNHVQLVVPARGATPAITKMFDVNYVLGQKMSAGRQQTVVVDYRSQVETEEMDYNIMEYEQTMLDIL